MFICLDQLINHSFVQSFNLQNKKSIEVTLNEAERLLQEQSIKNQNLEQQILVNQNLTQQLQASIDSSNAREAALQEVRLIKWFTDYFQTTSFTLNFQFHSPPTASEQTSNPTQAAD